MSEVVHITDVAVVLSGVLRLAWDDGYEGLVDLRPLIADGDIFEPLRSPDRFRTVRLSDFGHSVFWLDDEGDEVDFGCDRLRELAERQAALLKLAG